MYKTHTCGELRGTHAGQTVKLAGWVHRRRDHGGVVFIDLRDRFGLTQVVINPTLPKETLELVSNVRSEWVLQIIGKVQKRPDGMENLKMATGEVEIIATKVVVLNPAKALPFMISSDEEVEENTRLKYRYLDLRRERMRRNLELRHEVVLFMRKYLSERGFLEIETPALFKTTPEGARDYLVPSRIYPGQFYALPQSPQQLKQLLMVAGMERYFQIARCFRDEDQRGDRQPEFTQLDLEMSFVHRDDILAVVEDLFTHLVKEILPHKHLFASPWPRITYTESMERYGNDKPDLRFGMELVDLDPALGEGITGFRVFDEVRAAGGRVKAIVAPGMADASRSGIDELTEFARRHGARGLAHISVLADGPAGAPAAHSPIAKFLGDDRVSAIAGAAGVKPGDLMLIVADADAEVVADVLGRLRQELGLRLGLADENVLAFCWVYHFPMYQWDSDGGRWHATHNPFSGVLPEDEKLLVTASGDPYKPSRQDPAGKARALQYDIALNGWELGGGSVRIHKRELLERSFALQGYSLEQMHERFGGILEAFDYGAPPHGGIAIGIDRWSALFAHQTNIREVMAFPKTQSGADLMLDAPSAPEPEQYSELGLRFVGLEIEGKQS